MKYPESTGTAMRSVVSRPEQCQTTIEGDSYYAFAAKLAAAKLADNASIDVILTTGATTNAYLFCQGQCGGDAEFYVHENVTDIVGGSLFAPINKNRQSTKTSSCGVLIQPTSVTLNGVIFKEIILGGSMRMSSGSSVTSTQYVLKPNTSYLFRLTNKSGSARLAEIQLAWCEL